ncbi:MAG TPA: hypothetical protein VHH10_04525 [Rubrobacteraceae bacterium]|nr:hypothetical protein [Rubrobacteraceae bacterium]
MRKVLALVATMALMLVASAPAFAQDDYPNDHVDPDRYVDSNYPTGNVYINNWR